MTKLYLEDVQKIADGVCGSPGCTNHAFFLHAQCHPRARLEVFAKKDGIIGAQCAECKKPVAEFALASRPAPVVGEA